MLLVSSLLSHSLTVSFCLSVSIQFCLCDFVRLSFCLSSAYANVNVNGNGNGNVDGFTLKISQPIWILFYHSKRFRLEEHAPLNSIQSTTLIENWDIYSEQNTKYNTQYKMIRNVRKGWNGTKWNDSRLQTPDSRWNGETKKKSITDTHIHSFIPSPISNPESPISQQIVSSPSFTWELRGKVLFW